MTRRLPDEPGNARGEAHGMARLTAEQVAELRQRAAAGEAIRDLAAAFGIGYTTAFKAIRGLTWKHLEDPPPLAVVSGHWSAAELDYLREHPEASSLVVARALGRSGRAVRDQRHRHRLRRRAAARV